MTQRITINGVVFVVSTDANGGVTKIVTPGVKDPTDVNGRPFEVDYDPAGTLDNVYAVYRLLMDLGLL